MLFEFVVTNRKTGPNSARPTEIENDRELKSINFSDQGIEPGTSMNSTTAVKEKPGVP
jgi:hypothetical protein